MKLHDVVVIEHVSDPDDIVYCWGVTRGAQTVKACLTRGEDVSVRKIQMTTKQYDALEDYDGECD